MMNGGVNGSSSTAIVFASMSLNSSPDGGRVEFMSQLSTTVRNPDGASDIGNFFQELREQEQTLTSEEKRSFLEQFDASSHCSREVVKELAQGLLEEVRTIHEPIVDGVSLLSKAQDLFVQSKNDVLLSVLLEVASEKGIVQPKADGSVFLGPLNAQNQRHGVGIWKLPSGEGFVGKFENNGLNGEAKWCSADTTSYYEGQFENGCFHGKGTQVGLGFKYDGDFQHSKRQGHGVFTSTNGLATVFTYDGKWQDDVWHGQGTLTYATSQEQYEGAWAGGQKNGQGKWTSSDGQVVYDGEFKNDLFDGEGERCYSGISYKGTFVQGKCHGKGVQTEANGTVYDGEFINDKLHGEVRVTRTEYFNNGVASQKL